MTDLLLNARKDIKRIPLERLPALCRDIRAHLLENLSQNGGHLASNLGVIELTIALHRMFDTSKDRIVFDVGHQCYTHKLLSGRLDDFSTFRQFGATSGFPKPSESVHDAFVSGHASTSISAALGMARARTLSGQPYHVAAVIGDGALTGGLAYEALSDAGQSGEPLIVVLNDNEMSITRNVGGIARHLSNLRVKPQYFRAKRVVHRVVDGIPGGQVLGKLISGTKRTVKEVLLPETIFEQMGFTYLGPMDGHDIGGLCDVLQQAIALKRPVLVHVITVKGKGYRFSEEDPSHFHGVNRFNLESGKAVNKKMPSFSSVFGRELAALGAQDQRICAITAAMQEGTGLDRFARRFPKRFFDVGIAESHAVTMAAGLAKQGMRPVVAIYSTFLQRAYDQIIHDVAIQKLPVVFAVDRAGLVGEDGETHHGVFDVLFLTSVPHMRLMCPASFAELRAMLRAALAGDGPMAIRYPRGGEGRYTDCALETARLGDGSDATLVCYGTMVNEALEAAEILETLGIFCSVVKLPSLMKADLDAARALLRGRVYLLEENVGVLPRHFSGMPVNLDGVFVQHGDRSVLLDHFGLSAAAIARKVADG